MTAVTDEMRCQQHEQRQWNEPFGLSSGDVKCHGEKKLRHDECGNEPRGVSTHYIKDDGLPSLIVLMNQCLRDGQKCGEDEIGNEQPSPDAEKLVLSSVQK